MANAWILHVRDFADKKKMKYTEAMKSQECKDAYKKGKPQSNDDMKKEMPKKQMSRRTKAQKVNVEVEQMKAFEPPMEVMNEIKIKKTRTKMKE